MNLEESDSYKKAIEKNTRQRRAVMISIAFCAIIVALLSFLIIAIMKIDAETMKVFINGTQISIPKDFIREIDKEKYCNIKLLAPMLGYTYNSGEYKKYNENDDSCYLQDSFEIVAITANKDYYTKYLEFMGDKDTTLGGLAVQAKNVNGYKEDFYLDKKIKFEDGNIYVSFAELPRMLNIGIDWKNQYRLRIYNLDYIVGLYQQNLSNSGYSTISGYFENYKALLDGYAIVRNDEVGLYGIYSLDNESLLAGTKYDDIKYVQNMKNFFVTADNTMGLVDSVGKTVIEVQNYEEVSLLDELEQLYLVKKDKQYGVVNRNGEEVIYPEYDKIGIDISKFDMDDISNGNLLFGNYIPYYKEDEEEENVYKYGLLKKNGDEVPDFKCDDFGYKSVNNSISATRDRSTLIIPESMGIKGIIFRTGDQYGIFDATGKGELKVPASFDKIYLAIKEGKTEYYIESKAEGTILLSEYLKKNHLLNTSKDED